MMRFSVIATVRRGAVEPAEPLGDADQRKANQQAQITDAVDMNTLRYRATGGFRYERDPILSREEVAKLRTRTVEWGHVHAMHLLRAGL
jgi:hypothetical protein